MRSKAHGKVHVVVLSWRNREAVDAGVGLKSISGCLFVSLESGKDVSGSHVFESLGLVMILSIRPCCSGCNSLEAEVRMHFFIICRFYLNFIYSPRASFGAQGAGIGFAFPLGIAAGSVRWRTTAYIEKYAENHAKTTLGSVMLLAPVKKNKTHACNRASPQHFCMHRERPSIGGKFEKLSKITREHEQIGPFKTTSTIKFREKMRGWDLRVWNCQFHSIHALALVYRHPSVGHKLVQVDETDNPPKW
jgi:hypothetical protein